MIEGLKLKVASAELKAHCTARAEYHRRRAKDKEPALQEMHEAAAELEKVMAASLNPKSLAFANKSSGYAANPDDAADRIEADIKEHSNKALAFEFFAAHLFDEDYTLKEEDLVRLEILRR